MARYLFVCLAYALASGETKGEREREREREIENEIEKPFRLGILSNKLLERTEPTIYRTWIWNRWIIFGLVSRWC
jgi:hypothetical protein